MIDIKHLTLPCIGKWVLYTSGDKKEIGMIKSWNDKVVFVVYHCNNDWNNYIDYTGCATDPKDLEFTTVEVR